MRKLTAQKMFDKVWDRFITNRAEPSVDHSKDTTCRYRGPNGTRCAIGLFIPNRLYRVGMDEGMFVDDLMDTYPEVEKIFAGVDLSFLEQLQSTHDAASDPELLSRTNETFHQLMEKRLRNLAETFDLTVPG